MTWSNPCRLWRRHDVWRSFNLSRGRFPVTSGNFLYNIAPIHAVSYREHHGPLAYTETAVLCRPRPVRPRLRFRRRKRRRCGMASRCMASLLLPADFDHLPYANPQAPKGGRITLALQGTFDSLNPLIVLGVAPDVVPRYVLQSLMMRSTDEPFTVYGLVARSVEMPEDRSIHHLQSRSARPFLRWAPADRRGRALLVRDAEEARQAVSPLELRAGQGRRDSRSAPHPVRPDRVQRPGTAADHRHDADLCRPMPRIPRPSTRRLSLRPSAPAPTP